MNAAVQAPGPSGLEFLEGMLTGERAAPIGKTLGFTLVEAEAGRVVFKGAPGPEVYNPIGTVHGGYAATLLDTVTGCAVHSRLKAGQGYTTLELKVAYHRALTDKSGPVRAEGRVVSLGRRAGFAEGKLFDKDCNLCASATSTCLVFSQ